MRRHSRGSSLIEFALALPLLVILVFGTIDGARIFATWNRVKNGAHEGAAYAQFFPLAQTAVGTSCASPNNIQSRVQAEGSDLIVSVFPLASPLCQAFTPASAVQPGQSVTVTVTAPFTFITPIAKSLFGNPVVKAKVTVTVQG